MSWPIKKSVNYQILKKSTPFGESYNKYEFHISNWEIKNKNKNKNKYKDYVYDILKKVIEIKYKIKER